MPKTIAATAPHRVILRRVSGTTVITIPAIVKRTLGWALGDMMAVEQYISGVRVTPAVTATDNPMKLRRISGTTIIVIPAELQRTLGWKTGETMVVQIGKKGVCIVAARGCDAD